MKDYLAGQRRTMAENKTAKTPTDGGTGFIDGVWHGPTAWQCQCGKPYTVTCISSTPLKREWVGLTDDVVFELADTNLYEGGKNFGVLAFAKAIEQALKEKNT
jgi:hypothetical protein